MGRYLILAGKKARGEIYLGFLLLLLAFLLFSQQLQNAAAAKKQLQSIDVYKELKNEQSRHSIS
jgi:hypothetical protein